MKLAYLLAPSRLAKYSTLFLYAPLLYSSYLRCLPFGRLPWRVACSRSAPELDCFAVGFAWFMGLIGEESPYLMKGRGQVQARVA